MATRRTTIEIDVQGLAQLQQANTALNRHNTIIQNLTSSYQAFNAATGRLGPLLTNITNNFTTLNATTNTTTNNITNMGNAANRAGGMFGGLLGTMLQYRAVGAVFQGIETAVRGAVTAMFEMEKQAARVQRVSAPGSSPGIRADIAEEAARTGAAVGDIGEAYYQLKTQIKDNATAFSALRTSMNLVVGTESDARDTTRAMLQVYNQFGNQLGQNVDQAERMRRAGELLAVMWKGSAAEIGEITNALKYLGPVAESAGVPLNQVAATLSALTFEGVRGRMGGTEAAQLISQIIKNYNPTSGLIENKGASAQAAFTPQGGLDLIRTLENIASVAKRLPTEDAKKFSQAIAGSMNAWRLLGTVDANFLKILQEKLNDASGATRGLTHETNKLKDAMMTTGQEWKRVWEGSFALLSNLIDSSPMRAWLHGIAEDLQRLGEESRHIVGTNARMGSLLSGGGRFPGDPDASRAQGLAQLSVLQGMVNEARTSHLRGKQTFSESMGGLIRTGPGTGGDGVIEFYQKYEAMTPEERGYMQRFMQTKQIPGPFGTTTSMRQTTVDFEAMEIELSRLQSSSRRPGFGQIYGPSSSLRPANPFTGGRDVKGGYKNPKDDKDAERAAREAEKAAQEALDNNAKRLQTQFEFVKKLYGPDFPETKHAAALADAASAAAGDEDTRRRMKLGLDGNVANIRDESKQLSEEQQKEAQQKYREIRDNMEKSARTDYDLALQKYGLFSGPNGGATGAAAAAAQRTEEAAAIAEGPAGADRVRRLRDGLEGTGAEFAQKRQGVLERQIPSFGDTSIPWDKIFDAVARNLGQATDKGIRARQRGLPATDLYGDQATAQTDALKADAADIQATIDKLSGMNQFLPEVVTGLERFRDALEDNAAQQRRLREEEAQKQVNRIYSDVTDKYAKQLSDLENKNIGGVGESSRQAEARERGLLIRKIAFAESHYAEIAGLNFALKFGGGNLTQEEKSKEEQADIARKQAKLALVQYDRAKVEGIRGPIQSRAQQTVLGFLHGQGDVGDLFKGLGDEIVNKALQPFVKSLTDPLVIATTKQILSLDKVSISLDTLTNSLSSSGPGTFTGNLTDNGGDLGKALGAGAAAAAAGVVGALEAGTDGTAKPAKGAKRAGQSDLEKGLGAGLAAYSIASTSAQQGVNLGNLLGGVASGASIGSAFGPSGGLIGGAIGGIVDLIGGLFHQSKKPTATPQDLNPAFYNAPAGFDVAAYNYSAYGKFPTMQNVGFDVKAQTPPTFNVYIDGAKTAARVEINRQAANVNVSLNNDTMDRFRPI